MTAEAAAEYVQTLERSASLSPRRVLSEVFPAIQVSRMLRMTLPLHERAQSSINDPLVRLTGWRFTALQPVARARYCSFPIGR